MAVIFSRALIVLIVSSWFLTFTLSRASCPRPLEELVSPSYAVMGSIKNFFGIESAISVFHLGSQIQNLM